MREEHRIDHVMLNGGDKAEFEDDNHSRCGGETTRCAFCGDCIQPGETKCESCGQSHSAVDGMGFATQYFHDFQQELRTGAGDTAIRLFIRNYSIPINKDDMMEFISCLDMCRRVPSQYQSAYNAKYKECKNWARQMFDGDPQIDELIKQTGKFSFSLLSASQKFGLGCLSLFVIFILFPILFVALTS